MKRKKQNWLETMKTFQVASTLGFIIAIPPIIGTFLGIFLDRRLGTTPFLTLLLILLGTLIGIAASIKTIKEIF